MRDNISRAMIDAQAQVHVAAPIWSSSARSPFCSVERRSDSCHTHTRPAWSTDANSDGSRALNRTQLQQAAGKQQSSQ